MSHAFPGGLSRDEAARPSAVRAACRSERLSTGTAGLAPGFVQANLVVLPERHAFDFLLFCQRNPRSCPLLEVLEAGRTKPGSLAPSADLRTDLPRYRIWRDSQLDAEVPDATPFWRDDLVSFLIGCSFTFEAALSAAGIPLRHVEQGVTVPMYRTNIRCRPAGQFCGRMVVSMRPMTPEQAIRAAAITARFPSAHGAPVHWGDAEPLGISSLAKPDYGDPVEIRPGETPVFWACGVTPQSVLLDATVDLAITHAPGCMFVSDLHDDALSVV